MHHSDKDDTAIKRGNNEWEYMLLDGLHLNNCGAWKLAQTWSRAFELYGKDRND